MPRKLLAPVENPALDRGGKRGHLESLERGDPGSTTTRAAQGGIEEALGGEEKNKKEESLGCPSSRKGSDRGGARFLLSATLLLLALAVSPAGIGCQARRGPPGDFSPTSARGEGNRRLDLPRTRSSRVLTVEDGDSVTLEDGRKLRYAGIDAPELGEELSVESRAANRRLVAGREIRWRPSGDESSDRYGRSLAVAWLEADDGQESINEKLLLRGLAHVYIKGPRSLSSTDLAKLLAAQREAIESRRGIWQGVFARARRLREPLVTTRFRLHRASCSEIVSHRPGTVKDLEEELLRGKSFCRACRPLEAR